MQLTQTKDTLVNQQKAENKKNIAGALALATCALLGTDVNATEQDWQFDSAFLFYGEIERVMAAEAMVNAKKEFADEQVLNVRLTLDTLTGASANGAVAQPYVQTFTRPSGKGQYQINANDTPLDNTFHDTRVQLNAQWTQPLAPNYTASAGVHLSKEYDYLSLGINGNLAIDFNQKNTTLSLGLSHFQDTFTPEGGLPKPYAAMLIGDSESPTWDQSFANTRIGDSETKTTTDFLIGLTQVINRRMLMQLNYSHSVVDGYLTDPFKVLSLVDEQGLSQAQLFENRPDQRTKQSVYWQSKYHFDNSIMDLSYRYMWDDWNIKSHTVDTRYRFLFSDNSYLEPHVRYYQQSAAEFYQPFLNQNQALPEFASADYRIGEMNAYTLGLKYGLRLSDGNDFAVRVEYYSQNPTDAGFSAPGALANQDLYPSIDALILQFSYSF